MTFPIFFDTNALFGAKLCDLTLQLAEEGAFRPLWSDQVLEELTRNLTARYGSATSSRVERMRQAFPDAAVTGYESLIPAMTCDEKDRHVLAAAARADAEVLVTFNVRDFPETSTQPFGIVVRTPDEFLQDQLDLYPSLCIRSIYQLADIYEAPALSPRQVVDALRASTPGFVEMVLPLL